MGKKKKKKKLLKIKIVLKWQLDLRRRKCDFSRNVKCNLSKDLSSMFPKTSVLESGAREKTKRKNPSAASFCSLIFPSCPNS